MLLYVVVNVYKMFHKVYLNDVSERTSLRCPLNEFEGTKRCRGFLTSTMSLECLFYIVFAYHFQMSWIYFSLHFVVVRSLFGCPNDTIPIDIVGIWRYDNDVK